MTNDFSLNSRAKSVLTLKNVSVNSFASMSGLLQGTINPQLNGTKAISIQTILAILAAFPDVSAEWLLRGEGEMLKTRGGDNIINNAASITGNANAGCSMDGSDIASVIAAKDQMIEELKKDKEMLHALLMNITKR